MKVQDLFENREPVPTLSSLWRYSDEFSPETNEHARKAAIAEIARIKANNAKNAADRKTATKSFEKKSFSSFGFPSGYVKEYVKDTLEYVKKHPRDAADMLGIDPSEVTASNLIPELLKKAKEDKYSDPESFVAHEIFRNGGTTLERKYKKAYDELEAYVMKINSLNPKKRKEAMAELDKEMVSALGL